MFGWAPPAVADDVTLVEARELGAPDSHTALAGCDCIALSWRRDSGEARFTVDRGSLQEIRHDVTEGGRHDLSLVLKDGTGFSLEQAPCAVSSRLANLYSTQFGVPVTGSGVGVSCVDAMAAIHRYQRPELVKFTSPTYSKIATLTVTASGESQGDLLDLWSRERPWLGRCFPAGSAVHTVFSARVERDGTLSHLRVETAGPDPAVDTCLAGRVANLVATEGNKRRVLVDVGPGAAPGGP